MAEGQDYPVNIVFDAIDRVTASARRINSRIERLTGPFKRLNNRMRALDRASGFMRLRESIGRVGSATGRVLSQFGRLASRLTMIGGLAGFALGRVVSQVANTGDEIAKFARSIGISTDFLQEYHFAAERLGVSQSQVNEGFLAFDKRLGEMKDGYGRLNTLLKKTNPELQAQLEAANGTEEAFTLLMSAMSKMGATSERSALSAAAFSRSNMRLQLIAEAGSEEVNRLRRRAHELGLILDGDALKASEGYQDSLTNMQSAMSGLKNIIGATLMPVFSDLMDRMTIFFVNNREEIREWAEGFAKSIPDRLRAIRDGAVELFESLQPLIDAIQWMFDRFGTGETIAGALALVLGGPLLAAIASLALALGGLGVVMATTPVGWFLAGIAAIAAGIWAANKAMDWVRDNWPDGWEGVSKVIGIVVDALLSLVDIFTGDFSGLMERIKRMGGAIERMLPDWLKNWLGSDDDKTITVRDETGRNAGQSSQGQGDDTEGDGVERLRQRARDDLGIGGARGAVQSTTHTERRESRLSVDFRNLPRGTRVEQEGDANEDIDLGMGFAMGMP